MKFRSPTRVFASFLLIVVVTFPSHSVELETYSVAAVANAEFIGVGSGDSTGGTISTVGDFNGDGVDDFLISSSHSDWFSGDEGAAYLIYGTGTGAPLTGSMSLSEVGVTVAGVVFHGGEQSRNSCGSVSGAGDINHDGVDDVIVNEDSADANGETQAGKAFLIYGASGASALSGLINLDNVGGSVAGAVFEGNENAGNAGSSVSGAGDINADGVDDLLIGADGVDRGNHVGGEVYLIYGAPGASAPSGTIDLADVGGSVPGATYFAERFAQIGRLVNEAGDVNGDGVDDFIIGASSGGPDGNSHFGYAFLVYGGAGASAPTGTLDLANLGGSIPGARFNGIEDGDYAGKGVGCAGDVNADGFDDVLIGALAPGRHGPLTRGEVCLIYGGSGAAAPSGTYSIADIGVTLPGAVFYGTWETSEYAGRDAGAGDVNGDGFDDFLIATRYTIDVGGPNELDHAGRVFIIYGRPQAVAPSGILNLEDVGVTFAGTDIRGTYSDERLGERSVGSAGDVNADGVDDMLITFGTPSLPSVRLVYGEDSIGLLTPGTNGLFSQITPAPFVSVPNLVTPVHFGPAQDPDILFSVVGVGKYYFFDNAFGQPYTLTPGSLTKTAGTGNTADLWADGAARMPDCILGWDPDGDNNDEVWAFVGPSYFVFDWSTQKFGPAQSLASIGAGGVVFNKVAKYDDGAGLEKLVAVNGSSLYVYNPTTVPSGAILPMSALTSDASSFAPDFIVRADEDSDESDSIYVIDLATDRWWLWNEATDKFEVGATAFSSLWPSGTVTIDPTEGDFLFSYKGDAGAAPPRFFAIEHQ